ncbi:MAG: serine hydrolase [Thermoanaerobaculia bacterium]
MASSLLPVPAAAQQSVAAPSLPELLTNLESFASSAMVEEKIPGMAYAVVKDDQVVFAKGFGVKKLGESAPIDDHTIFEVGSTTKAFTAALLGMLVDEGKLSWDDRVVDILPDFRMYEPYVTRELRIADLVSQRSGTPAYSLDMMSYLGFSRTAIEHAIRHVEPATSFRSTFGYVNHMWLIAGRVVEKVSGFPWEANLDRRIFGPLGMRESTADPEIVPLLPDVAVGHSDFFGGVLRPLPPDWPYRSWLDVYGPAGNIRSNVLDMAFWARLHLGRGRFEGTQIVKADTVDTLHASRVLIAAQDGKTLSYASGWLRQEDPQGTIVWHNGETAGMHSIVALYPSSKMALIVLTNTNINHLPERMKEKLFDLLHPAVAQASVSSNARRSPTLAVAELALQDAPPRPSALVRPLIPIPSLPLARYTGTYENPAYGRAVVKEKNGALVLVIGPLALEAPILPYSGNTWTLHFPDGPRPDTVLTFSLRPGQPADRFVAAVFDEVRGGTFTRVP